VRQLSIGLHLASVLLALNAFALTSSAQLQSVSGKLPLKAELVLSPQLCSAKTGHYINGDLLSIGKKMCPQIEAELSDIFSELKPVDKLPAAGSTSAQVVLIPKLVDISVTQPLLGSSEQELLIVMEWTVQDAAGKTVWLQTVQGSSHRKRGWIVTPKRRSALVEAAAEDLAKASATRMSNASELRHLAP